MRTWQKAILLTLIIIAIPLFYFENRYFSQQVQSSNLKNQQTATLHRYHHDAGNQYAAFKTYFHKQKSVKYYYFVPTNVQNQPLDLLNAEKKLAQKLNRQLTSANTAVKDLTIYVTYQSTNIQDDTYAFNLSATAFGTTTKRFKTTYQRIGHLDGPEQIYNLADQIHPVTFKALTNNGATEPALKRLVINQLIERHTYSWSEVQALQKLTFSDQFDYTTDGLTLHFAPNELKLTQLELPLKTVGPYLNPDYVAVSNQASQVSGRHKAVALTFNTTLKPKVTQAILKTLTEHNISATFLTTGAGAKTHPQVLKDLLAAHQKVGVQTYQSDDNPANLSATDWQQNLTKTDQAFYQASGQLPQYQRLPLDTANAQLAQIAQRPFIEWSVDSQDWSTTITAPQITENVIKGVTGGDLVLLHTTATTNQALPTLIQQLKAKGYHFTTVDDLFKNQLNPQQQIFKVGDKRPL